MSPFAPRRGSERVSAVLWSILVRQDKASPAPDSDRAVSRGTLLLKRDVLSCEWWLGRSVAGRVLRQYGDMSTSPPSLPSTCFCILCRDAPYPIQGPSKVHPRCI